MSAAEAALIAGVSRQHLHNIKGQFKTASRLSGMLVFRRSEIEKYAKDRAAGLESEPAE